MAFNSIFGKLSWSASEEPRNCCWVNYIKMFTDSLDELSEPIGMHYTLTSRSPVYQSEILVKIGPLDSTGYRKSIIKIYI